MTFIEVLKLQLLLMQEDIDSFLTDRLGIKNRAFVNLIVPGIMTIIIGGVLLVIGYVVLSAVITGIVGSTQTVGGVANSTMNSSFWSTVGIITQSFGIAGISLIIVGIAMIVYTLYGLAGGGAMGRR